jgi:hemerythrin
MPDQPVQPTSLPTFVWTDEMSVGVAAIDEQHRRLIDMIAAFYAAIAEKTPAREALAQLLRGLVGYTHYHFTTEERLMERSGFPAASAHREQHAAFASKVGDMSERVARGQLVLSIEATLYLREWLTQHILMSDKQLGRHLGQHDVR